MTEQQTNWTVGTTYWKWFFTNTDTMLPLNMSIILDILILVVYRSDFKDVSLLGRILSLALVNSGSIAMTIYSIFWWKQEKSKLK